MVNNDRELPVPATTADAHPAAFATGPRTTPGAAYWLLTVLVMPIAGTIGALLLYSSISDSVDHASVFSIAIVVTISTALISQLPRLRAMQPRRHAGYCVGSAVLQVALGFVYGYGTLMAICSGGGCGS
jgi:hypothetical protein